MYAKWTIQNLLYRTGRKNILVYKRLVTSASDTSKTIENLGICDGPQSIDPILVFALKFHPILVFALKFLIFHSSIKCQNLPSKPI